MIETSPQTTNLGDPQKGHDPAPQKKTMRNILITLFALTLILGYGTLRSVHYLQQNKQLQAQAEQLRAKLEVNSTSLNNQMQIAKAQLTRQLTKAREQLERVTSEKEELAVSYQQQLAALKQDQENRLEGSITKLDEQARVIQTVIDQLGVKVDIKEDPDHSGGPFISQDSYCDKLICESDRFLNTIQSTPLGRPVKTRISSPFGKRSDPLNGKRAFHSGVDFRGNTGDKVVSTGDAVVKKSCYNKGYGYNIVLSHGNGYETMYAHLSKRLVKKGDRIKRGQVIGLVGNSGRSTGSHLHYEVRRYGKAVNPIKYMQISDMTVIATK